MYYINRYHGISANSNGEKPFDGAFLFACKCIFINRQSSGSRQAVVRQSSGSHQAVVKQCKAVDSSGLAVIRKSLCSFEIVKTSNSSIHICVGFQLMAHETRALLHITYTQRE